MIPDKEIKRKFRPVFWKDPDRFFPTSVLKEEGFFRSICPSCKKPFWSTDRNRKVCGDPSCGSKFDFIGNSPAKNKLGYIKVWDKYSKMFSKFGYTPIKRYPVVSRWNPTMEYTNASIAAFQPFVISGEVEPPARKLVIPQFCLRFSDVDNVGVTGSHHTGFVMLGQHMFVKPKDWNQNEAFRDIYTWITKGMGLPKEEVTFHEDAWAGGGDFGCCMEFFSHGCEIGNQVYMLYSQTNDSHRELDIKVLDMGMGQERCAWFTQGTPTIYDSVFPKVLKHIYSKTGVRPDIGLQKKFGLYAGLLNVDETENISKAWQTIAKEIGEDTEELKKKILSLAAVYSIAEHSRSLLFAINDGGLPSNVGGGYNLRVILRRALSFICDNNWDLDLKEITRLHSSELQKQFPELGENIDEVMQIIGVEEKKFSESRLKSQRILLDALKQDITREKLIELYDSHGINPEELRKQAASGGKKIDVPDNFYALVSERHEKKEGVGSKEVGSTEIDLAGLPDTEILYFDSYKMLEFEAKVLKIIDHKVILDRTAFYPTSGGQLHDTGTLGKSRVVDIRKQGSYVVHTVDAPAFKEGERVKGKIDFARRLQLSQNHTAAHIINGSARKILGNHVWQAGAEKTLEKARLDITHYEQLTCEEVAKIEALANDIVNDNIVIEKKMMPRNLAETQYGFRLYQGGAVPGKNIRVVNIPGFDVEACGGTHLDFTGEAELIKILRTSKIQDGVVRIEFIAGDNAIKLSTETRGELGEIAKLLDCEVEEIPGRTKELFILWKDIVKKKKDVLFKLTSHAKSSGNILAEAADILSTQKEHVKKTIERFLKEIKGARG